MSEVPLCGQRQRHGDAGVVRFVGVRLRKQYRGLAPPSSVSHGLVSSIRRVHTSISMGFVANSSAFGEKAISEAK